MKSEKPIRIMLADDHEIFRDGFAGLMKKQPDIDLIGQAENGKELINLASFLQPDVILTDISMPVMDGIEATKFLNKNLPKTKIIALTMFNDDNYVLDMMNAGASGYLLKNTHKTDIIDAIKAVYNGEIYYCRETSVKLLHLMAAMPSPVKEEEEPELLPEFSEKELDVIRFVCREMSNKEMSTVLNLSVRTIEGYRKRIQAKMKVRNAVGIVVYSIKHSLVEL